MNWNEYTYPDSKEQLHIFECRIATLYREVIMRAYKDKDNLSYKKEIENWIGQTKMTEDYLEVCKLAKVDPHEVWNAFHNKNIKIEETFKPF